jgi:hypothetical protein
MSASSAFSYVERRTCVGDSVIVFLFLCHLCPQLLLSASAASWSLHSFFFCDLCGVVLLLILALSHQYGATYQEAFSVMIIFL